MEKRSGTKRKAETSKELQPTKKEKVKKKSSQPQPLKEKRKKPPLTKKPKLESPKKREKDDLEPPKTQKKVPAPPQKSAKQSVVKKPTKVGKENPSKTPKKKNSNKLEKHQDEDHVVNTPLKALNNKKEMPLCPPEPPKCFSFKVEDCQIIITAEGRKSYCCDICQGEYKRIFSLKRHYLRFHLNYLYLSEQDVKNCGLVTPDKTAIDSNILAQQASITSTKASLRKDGKNLVDFPNLFRCHLCGTLVDTKALLVEHLSGHKQSITTQTDLDSQKDTEIETFICRRCHKSFTARKLYRAHQKNVKCGRKSQQVPSIPTEPVTKLAAVPALCTISTMQTSKTKWRALAAGMDAEESLKLGNASSTFRYACTICLKMFVTYTNMCRHRRLAHGIHHRYPDICAKLLGDPSTVLHEHSDASPKPPDEEQTDDTSSLLAYDKIEANVKENIKCFLDGITLPSETPEADDLKLKLMSWDNYTVTEANGVGRQRLLESVFKLEIPVQIALQKGLNQLEANSAEEREKKEESGFHGALNLIPKSQLNCQKKQSYEGEGGVFSGEWTRLRRFLCGTCGQKFESLPEVEWHQQDVHPRVFCSYLMMEGEEIPPEISRQFEAREKMVPENDMTQTTMKTQEDDGQYKCTKCAEGLAPGAGLHAHMLECAGDLTWQLEQQSHSRKRRSGKKKRPQGRHGMRRNHSQTPVKTATNTGTRSQQKAAKRHSYDLANRVQVTRRFLHFHEQKSKEQKPPLDIVKKDSSASDISCTAQTPLSSSRNSRSSIPVEETDPGPIQATSALTLNPHNPGLTNLGIFTCPTCGKQYMYSFPYQKHRSKCPAKSVSPPKKSKKNTMPTLTPAMASSPNPRPQSAKGMDDQDPLPPLLQPEPPATTLVAGNEDSQEFKPEESDGPSLLLRKAKKTVNKKKQPKAESETGSTVTSVSEEDSMASLEPEGEPAETGERLRTRSARRGISYTSYEHTELDPSFLAALSETQRDHVTEQRCPFCRKQYTYKSNFKKHLLEGCMTLSAGVQKRSSAEEEPEASEQPGVKKAKMQGRKSMPRAKSPSGDMASETKGYCVICFAEFRDEKEFIIHRLAHCLAAGSHDLKIRFTGLVHDQGKKNEWVGWQETKWEEFLKTLKRTHWDRLAKELVQDVDCDRLIQEIVAFEKEANVRESELGTGKDSLVASIVQPFIQDIMKKEMALWSQKNSTVPESPVWAAVSAPESTNEPQSRLDRLVIEEDRGDSLSMDANSDAEKKVACPDVIAPVAEKLDSQDNSAEMGDCGSSYISERSLRAGKEAKESQKCTLDSSLTLSVVAPSQNTPPLLNHDSSANSFVCAECGKEFCSAQMVFQHMNMDHPLNFPTIVPSLRILSAPTTPTSQNKGQTPSGETSARRLLALEMPTDEQKTELLCPFCGRVYKSFMGRWKHMSRCEKTAKLNSGVHSDCSWSLVSTNQQQLVASSSPSQQLERLQDALRQAIGTDCSIAVLGTEPNDERACGSAESDSSVKGNEWKVFSGLV